MGTDRGSHDPKGMCQEAFEMSIAQNRKLERISDHTLVIGVDIAEKRHVARAGNSRGVELSKPLTFDNCNFGQTGRRIA